MGKIRVVSEFVDYYDNTEVSGIPSFTYDRTVSKLGRIRELAKLRDAGVKTIDIMSVRDTVDTGSKIVVYTDYKKHHGEGKSIMSVDSARLMYGNAPCCEYFEKSAMTTYKIIKIGKKQVKLVIENSVTI